MLSKGGWRVRGLLLLAVAGCSHGSGAGHEQFPGAWSAEDSGIRTKGGDSATLHIQALIAQGQMQEAEAYLVQAIAAGLVAREAATRLQEKIAERKQQPNADQDRRVPRGNLEDWEIEEPQRRTCATEMRQGERPGSEEPQARRLAGVRGSSGGGTT
jgi:hypothetical protein